MFSTPVSWTRSLLAAAVAIYAPFALLCLFMLAFERQWSNMMTALKLLPYAPCVLPALAGELISRPLRFDLPDFAERAVLYAATPAFIVAVASLGRLGREWLVGGAVAAFFINGIAAYWMLGAIRM